MSSSLSNLVNNLSKINNNQFKITKQSFDKQYGHLINESNFHLLLKKGNIDIFYLLVILMSLNIYF